MQRRKFLKAGVGIAVGGVMSFKQLWARPEREAGVKGRGVASSAAKLQEIVRRYGSELGQLKPENMEG